MTDLAPVPDPLVPLVADVDLDTLHEVGDLARLHAALAAVEAVVADVRKPVRDRLDTVALADAAGEGLSRKVADVGTVIVDDPKPSARVTDPEAFASWVEACDPPPMRVERRQALALVADPAAQRAAVVALASTIRPGPAALSTTLAAAVEVVEEVVLPADPIDAAVAAGAAAVWHTAVVDLDTGEPVPGTAVTPPRPQRVSIRPDKAASKVAAAHVRRALRQLAERTVDV